VRGDPPYQFPHPLNRVELWTVGWKKVHGKTGQTLSAPPFMEFCMMVLGVIEDQLHSSSRMATYGPEVPQKNEEGFRVELFGAVEHELPVSQAYRAKITDTLAGRMVIDHRVFCFGGNPHTAARPVQLKSHLVHRPEVNLLILCDCV